MVLDDGVWEFRRASAANADSMLGGDVNWPPSNAVSTASENAVLRLGDMPSLWLILCVRMCVDGLVGMIVKRVVALLILIGC